MVAAPQRFLFSFKNSYLLRTLSGVTQIEKKSPETGCKLPFIHFSFHITVENHQGHMAICGDFLYTRVNKRTYNFPFLPSRVFYFLFFEFRGNVKLLWGVIEMAWNQRYKRNIWRRKKPVEGAVVCSEASCFIIRFRCFQDAGTWGKGEVENSRKRRMPGSCGVQEHPLQVVKAACILFFFLTEI